MSLVRLYLGVYETFDSSDVDLHTAAENSVYFARCFGAPLVLCGIQVFLNFSGGFVYSSYVMFPQNPAEVVSYSMDVWKERLFGSVFLSVGCF